MSIESNSKDFPVAKYSHLIVVVSVTSGVVRGPLRRAI